jgi:phosphatidate phosphatase PAH1
MITKEKIEKARLSHDQLRNLEFKLNELMIEYKFIGFAKYLKWSMMSYAFERAIVTVDIDGDDLEKNCQNYINNIWSDETFVNS